MLDELLVYALLDERERQLRRHLGMAPTRPLAAPAPWRPRLVLAVALRRLSRLLGRRATSQPVNLTARGHGAAWRDWEDDPGFGA